MFEITRWRSLTDAHGKRASVTWAELAAMLATPAPRPADAENPKLAGWSPATFEGNRRKKIGVQAVPALGLDFDTGALPLERLLAALDGLPVIIHSTRRYTPTAPRWRGIVKLSRAMTGAEHEQVWTQMRAHLGALGIMLDDHAKDPSRFWYLPCEPVEGEYIFHAAAGKELDVDAWLAMQVAAPQEIIPNLSESADVPAKPPRAEIASDEPEALRRITLSTRRRRALAYVARAEASVSGQDGHKVAMRVSSAVVRGFALGSSAEALAVLETWNVRCEPPWSASELGHKVREAMRVGAMPWGKMLLADAEPDEGPARAPSVAVERGGAARRLIALPDLEAEEDVIRIDVDLHRVVDQAVEALSTDASVYQRDAQLVTVVRVAESETDASELGGAPQIRGLAVATLRERLCSVSKWKKQDTRTKKWKPSVPDDHVIHGLAARGQWRGIRPLVGVIETPSLRPDGSVIQQDGYDAATGFLLVPGADFPEVPESPTLEDAQRALAELSEPLLDFPYGAEFHRSATLSAILTLLARPAIEGSVPGIVFSASTRGAGKTLQSDVVSLIATGRESAKMGYPAEDEELEKTLGAYALRGALLVNFDNVTRPFGGGPLDRCLTAGDRVELRVLGKSEVPSLRWRAMIMATGNNVDIAGDTARRVMKSQIESPLENPEERTGFRHPDLLGWVRANRTRLVVAGLTILRAYVVAGRPDVGTKTWGSFESWARLIPPALVWAGAPDPMLARPTNDISAEPEKAALAVLVGSWGRLAGTEGLTAKSAIGALYPPMVKGERTPPDGFDDLRECIEMLTNAQHGRPPSPSRLGYVLRRSRKRNVGGKLLDSAVTHGGSQRWFVIELKPSSKSSGDDVAGPEGHRHQHRHQESHAFSDLLGGAGDDGDDGDDAFSP